MVATNTPNAHGLRWLWLSIAVIAADYATKAAMVAAFQPGEERPYTSFFSLILTFNKGAAFSMFANAGGWQHWFFAIIAVAASLFIVWLMKRGGSAMYCAGLALILGGALGNLWDRLTIGKVVDFLLFHYQGWAWPAFNVADSAICAGAALLIVDSFRQRRAVDPDARVTSGGGN